MKLNMQLGERSYDIILKRGSLAHAHSLCNLNRKVLVVSDKGVPEKYIKTLLKQCPDGHSIIVEQGEGSKSVQTWQAVLSKMLELGFGRGDAVAAVGGGVIGDLSGFVASAYMRGISFFQFPTTTLSQIDSSIGGKVAINLGATKNVVGAFHQPEIVIIDPDTLQTLPARHFSNGLAEALKTALIGSSDLLDIMEHEDIQENIERILYLCLQYKKGVVERDETEQGERKLLNFGHTIGHAIESARGLGQGSDGLLHGECIALGMLPMLESKVLQRRTLAVMKKLNLPLKSGCTASELIPYLHNDKKRSGDTYTIVRVKKAGLGYLEKVSSDELNLLVEEGIR